MRSTDRGVKIEREREREVEGGRSEDGGVRSTDRGVKIERERERDREREK